MFYFKITRETELGCRICVETKEDCIHVRNIKVIIYLITTYDSNPQSLSALHIYIHFNFLYTFNM